MPGGRPPKQTALQILHGTFRRDRHGSRIDAPGSALTPATTPSLLSEAEQIKRKAEIEAQRKALYQDRQTQDRAAAAGAQSSASRGRSPAATFLSTVTRER